MIRYMIEAMNYRRRDIIRYASGLIPTATLDRLIERHGLFDAQQAHQFISDEELTDVIRYLRLESSLLSHREGVRTINGYLRSKGIIVSRTRILNVMRIIDADGVEFRRREIIPR